MSWDSPVFGKSWHGIFTAAVLVCAVTAAPAVRADDLTVAQAEACASGVPAQTCGATLSTDLVLIDQSTDPLDLGDRTLGVCDSSYGDAIAVSVIYVPYQSIAAESCDSLLTLDPQNIPVPSIDGGACDNSVLLLSVTDLGANDANAAVVTPVNDISDTGRENVADMDAVPVDGN